MAANEGGTGDDDKGRRGGRKGGGGKGGRGERRRQRKERRTTDGGKGRRRAEETGATKVVGADGDDGGQRRGQRESNRENNRTWAAGWAAAGPQAGVAPPPKSGPAVSRDAEEDEEGSRGSALWRQLIPSKCLIIPARKVVHDAGREASVDESGTNANRAIPDAVEKRRTGTPKMSSCTPKTTIYRTAHILTSPNRRRATYQREVEGKFCGGTAEKRRCYYRSVW